MRILILGGTAFLGREVARQGVALGHQVVCLARGRSGPVPEGAAHVIGDRDDPAGLDPVSASHWDAVIDVARDPEHVRRAVERLRTGHYVFVSTANVYADNVSRGLDETAAVLTAADAEKMPASGAYGLAKVDCERAVTDAFGPSGCTIARAGLIGGPGDDTGRSGYWPWRMLAPSNDAGEVLVPDAFDQPMQMIDVRDLAAWLLLAAGERIGGVFNTFGPPTTLGEMLHAAQHAVGTPRTWVSAPNRWLLEQGVTPWMGPRSLPLWIADEPMAGFLDRSIDRASAAGLTLRPATETFAGALTYEQTRVLEHRGAGLTDPDERALLAAVTSGVRHQT